MDELMNDLMNKALLAINEDSLDQVNGGTLPFYCNADGAAEKDPDAARLQKVLYPDLDDPNDPW